MTTQTTGRIPVVIGAGLGRTGTFSLKLALEALLGGPCYHMTETLTHPEHVGTWHCAARGVFPDWERFLRGYVATVDWPAAAFWRELSDAFPSTLVLLSSRPADEWWVSASETIFAATPRPRPVESGLRPWQAMVLDVFERRFEPSWRDRAAAVAAFERHNAAVRATIDAGRLVEWRLGDGWGPLCAALGVAEPEVAFPLTNTTAEFKEMEQDELG